ncbi:hypothetical protein FB451DRAFT_1167609 [Mycena latifolia]|nr:hypothetical protein FB451DRAFT_1167609 [Mycena latifolia]
MFDSLRVSSSNLIPVYNRGGHRPVKHLSQDHFMEQDNSRQTRSVPLFQGSAENSGRDYPGNSSARQASAAVRTPTLGLLPQTICILLHYKSVGSFFLSDSSSVLIYEGFRAYGIGSNIPGHYSGMKFRFEACSQSDCWRTGLKYVTESYAMASFTAKFECLYQRLLVLRRNGGPSTAWSAPDCMLSGPPGPNGWWYFLFKSLDTPTGCAVGGPGDNEGWGSTGNVSMGGFDNRLEGRARHTRHPPNYTSGKDKSRWDASSGGLGSSNVNFAPSRRDGLIGRFLSGLNDDLGLHQVSGDLSDLWEVHGIVRRNILALVRLVTASEEIYLRIIRGGASKVDVQNKLSS